LCVELGRIADGIRRWPDKNAFFIENYRLAMKAFWNTTSSFFVPIGVLLGALSLQGVPYESTAAFAVVIAFMVLKGVVEHFKFEPGRAIFAGVGREAYFRTYAALVYSVMGLGTLQLFLLATR
jgi:hypothetical protein